MEIRCSAFLRDMEARLEDGDLRIAGTVAGVAEGPLELYVVIDRQNVLYRIVAAGESFCLTVPGSAMPAGGAQKLRVELVNVSTIWYAWETAIASAR